MSLDKLKERIEKDASETAKQIKKDAQKVAEETIFKAKQLAEEEKIKHLEKAKKKVQIEKEAVLAKARLDARDLILKSKRNMLNKVVENVFDKASELSSQSYEKMLLKLLVNNGTGTEKVIMADSQVGKIVDEANKTLLELGKTAQLKASDENINEKGLILIDDIGTKTDLTLKSVIDFHVEELEQEVFDILSGKASNE